MTSRTAAISRGRGRLLPFIAVVAALSAVGLVAGGALRSAHAAQPGTILPDLVADPVDTFKFEPASLEEPRHSHHFVTHLLLRFNGYIHNKGPGAVDFRGSRAAPSVSSEALKVLAEHGELSQHQEEEFANPPMTTTQRLFTTNAEETNIDRPHVEEASPGHLIYSSADGHNHWHLQEIARYTLMSASKTEVVAPAQKVGFCLDDSGNQHVEPGIGPNEPVYSDAHGRKFCDEWEPNATKLFEGISPGWRDLYKWDLALQWVDISNVQPGNYQLRDEVNPLGFVIEEPGENHPAYSPITIPGYVAQPQSLSTAYLTAKGITLTAKSFAAKTGAKYEIVSGPSHGVLLGNGSGRTYVPAAGFSGTDSFTFRTREESSQFPTEPQIATVSIEVGENPAVPGLQITSAPSSLVAGTSGTLAAAAKNDSGAIEWSVSAGAVKAEGLRGESATMTAPSQAGAVTVTARLADNPSVASSREVTVTPVPENEPVVGIPTLTTPGNGGVAGTTTGKAAGLGKPRAMLLGRYLEMSAKVGIAGRVRLSVYWRKHLLGSCATLTPAGRTYTCRLKLAKARLHDKLRVVATLRAGDSLLATTLGPARIPKMVMVRAGSLSGSARSASVSSPFWCDPSTIVAALAANK